MKRRHPYRKQVKQSGEMQVSGIPSLHAPPTTTVVSDESVSEQVMSGPWVPRVHESR